MEKPFYKYKSYWLALAGLGLGYVYVKFLAKDKNLALGKSLLIGGLIGGTLGLGIDLMTDKKEEVTNTEITEESLNQLAKSISPDAESQLYNYLFLLKKANLSLSDNKKAYNVLNAFLLAKRDNKWDSKADIQGMKKILLSYGVIEDDFKVFQTILVNSLADVITNIFSKKVNSDSDSTNTI